jgi:hypothetical protein
VKTAGKSLELLPQFPFLPVGDLTREAVKSYVDAQKALMDAVVKPVVERSTHPSKPARGVKAGRAKKAAGAAA